MKHTPTPWQLAKTAAGKVKIADKNGFSIANLTGNVLAENEANAALIVTAVNNHEKLVSILQECVSNFECNRTGGCNGIWNTPEENSPYDKAKKLLTTLNP